MQIGYVIASKTVDMPGLGSEFLLDPELQAELAEFSDNELFSNEVMFELVPN